MIQLNMEEAFEEGIEKKDDEVEEKNNDVVEEKKDELEEGRQKNELDEEEKWKKIQERRKLEHQHTPPLPFRYKAVEKRLQEKFMKFLEHMRKVETKIPFLEVMEQMLQYAKYLKTLMGNKNKLESKVVNLLEQVNAII